MKFDLLRTDGRARRGRLTTRHGVVETPAFMPCGTQGSVKALSPADLREAGVAIVLANTYHLWLRPGAETVAALGGLHRFMGWDGPLLTDSGGFQVYSLAELRKVTEEGVRFRSHLDGSEHRLTPEGAMEIQRALGADISMCLDECAPYPVAREAAERALDLTLRWAARSRSAHPGDEPALFGIVQGGVHRDLRERGARELQRLGFPGYALGGLSIGESKAQTAEVLAYSAGLLPEGKPRYLMGVGAPEDLLDGIAGGIDLFDCVMPTRHARRGSLFTARGRLSIKAARHARDERPVEADCPCYACRTFSRAYLRHLFAAGEILALRLNTLHNVTYYMRLMASARSAIEAGRFDEYRRETLAHLAAGPDDDGVPAGEMGATHA